MKTLSLFAFLSFVSVSLFAQPLGLWEVTRVSVGEEELTPIAKWFTFEEDGTLASGNGGVTNLRGSYTYSEGSMQMYNTEGQADPYGPFRLEMAAEEATLTRTEDGNEVVVSMQKIAQKPLAPWDRLVGMWEKEAGPEALPERYFFRWDREYRAFTGETRERGLWHIHSHQPQLRILPNDRNLPEQSYTFTFSEDGTSLSFQDEEGNTITYVRASMD